MQSAKVAVLRGALIVAMTCKSKTTDLIMQAVGLTPDVWESFQQPSFWTPADAQQAVVTLSKALSLGYHLSQVPRLKVLAEEMAATISVLVHPCNWGVICSAAAAGLQGSQILTSNAETEVQIEQVSGERLYALVLAATDMQSTTYTIEDSHAQIS